MSEKVSESSGKDRSLLESVNSPADLRTLSFEQLDELSSQIRDFLIEKVSRSGGHLGPNLGVVELTIAIHREFNSPADPIVFDTGHQSYCLLYTSDAAANREV